MIRELTKEEIAMVSGGDAAITRKPGYNSWGESIPGAEQHFKSVFAEATYRSWANQMLNRCGGAVPLMVFNGLSAGAMHLVADSAGRIVNRFYGG
ncbi:hypothetical protein [Roseateles aquatilis]|uniref:hypothetical protein n=1 Tax=Roseateles aquatilis TaxID=431061 RepID=UPI0011329D4F|nr:hypothetical protein [Roseateles aquatilis]